MQNKSREREILKHIAAETGLSISSIYKIRSNSFAFSQERVEQVRRLAGQYGLRTEPAARAEARIGVLIPCRPASFWGEAAQGMKDCQRKWEAAGRSVQLLFFYYGSALNQTPAQPVLDQLEQADCDGYLLFPVRQTCCLNFICKERGAERAKEEQVRDITRTEAELSEDKRKMELGLLANSTRPDLGSPKDNPERDFGQSKTSALKPIILFNDLPRSWDLKLLQGYPNLAYIGADNREEGELAAQILEASLPQARHILTAISYDSLDATAAFSRIQRFREKALETNPRLVFHNLSLNPESKLTPALLAEEIWRFHQRQPVDCVYLGSGMTHAVCGAVEKLRRRYGEERASIVCIGHELLPSDRKYLVNGAQIGYVKQDVYSQGRAAVEELLSFLFYRTPLKSRYFRSSLFIRSPRLV